MKILGLIEQAREKPRLPVKPIRRNSESSTPVSETPSAFHRHAQWSIDRRRDARQHRRWFACENQRL